LWLVLDAAPAFDLLLLLLVSLELLLLLFMDEPIEDEPLLEVSFSLLLAFLVLGITLKFKMIYKLLVGYITAKTIPAQATTGIRILKH
jgi:hypothetical protein